MRVTDLVTHAHVECANLGRDFGEVLVVDIPLHSQLITHNFGVRDDPALPARIVPVVACFEGYGHADK